MRKKKVLIVSKYFYPDNTPRSFRTTELAKELVLQGHHVSLCIPNVTEEKKKYADEHNIVLKDIGILRFKDINISGNFVVSFLKRVLRRFLLLLFEYPDIELMYKVWRQLRKEKGYDLLISIAAPHSIHWGVAKAKAKWKIATTWIADCGDPFCGRENDSFPVMKYFRFIEKWMFKRTDYITIPVNSAINAYDKMFHSKIKVIPQGFKFNKCVRSINVTNEQVRFIYAGNFIPGRRDPSLFIDYLMNLDFDFVFHVYTGMSKYISKILERYRNKHKVIVHDLIPRELLIEKLKKFDFAVNINNIGVKQVPSKLIDYAICSIPILSIDSYDIDEDNVLRFLRRDYTGQLNISNIDRYKIEKVSAKFLSLCK